jgi:hypothetical protein
MIVVGTAVGMWLMVKYFMGVKKDYWKTGLVVGLVWLLMNWGLDLVTLVMLMKMDVVTYFTQIGLRYLSLPLMVFGAAYLLEKRK